MKLAFKMLIISAFAAFALSSCREARVPETRSVDEIYKDAMAKFNNGDLLESKTLFELIKLQYPASQFADDSQYYISEISFKREEYILAGFNYNMLRKIYPTSEHSKPSLYKSALCYYNLSLPYDREQDYTKKAIQSFQEFQYLYPDDSLSNVATKNIKEMREKLAQREYATAELYNKLQSPRSSVIYYDVVINSFDDTSFFELAIMGKIKTLAGIAKYDETRNAISIYRKNFPAGQFASQIAELEKTLR